LPASSQHKIPLAELRIIGGAFMVGRAFTNDEFCQKLVALTVGELTH
jgi:hypothetical protein